MSEEDKSSGHYKLSSVQGDSKHSIKFIMALIKNAYSPGQWFVFFYEAKNIEQTAYYNKVKMQLESWYSFLQKDQIQGKIFDFLGVPNICGKINKKQLHKIYAGEKSRRAFNKLDVQVKKIQLNETLQPSTSTFKLFKSKNRLVGKNSKSEDSMSGSQTVGSKLTNSHTKLAQQTLFDVPNQSNGNNTDGSCIDSDGSDEDVFADLRSKVKETKMAIPISKKPVNNETVRKPSVGMDVVQAKILHQNETHQPPTSIFKFAITKNDRQAGTNTDPGNPEEEIGLWKVEEGKTVVGKSKITEDRPKPQGLSQLDLSEQGNDHYTDDSSIISGSIRSDEDIFFDFKSKTDETKKIPVSKTPLNSETLKNPLTANLECGNVGAVSKESCSKVEEIVGLKQPALFSNAKKKVEFKLNENEYFFFKAVDSSTTQSSQSDWGIKKVVRFKAGVLDADRSPISFPIEELRSNQEDDGSNDDDNAFDTGFMSPIPDFCSAGPSQSQEMASPYEPATSDLLKMNTGIDSIPVLRFKPRGADEVRSPVSSPTQELCSGSHRGEDVSNDDDNAFDTGFMSPLPDFCSASPSQSQEIASSYGPTTTGTSQSIRSANTDGLFDGSRDDEKADEFKTVSTNGRGNESYEIPRANERDVAASHAVVLLRPPPRQELSVDQIRSTSLSVISTDDEILSQASAATEIFATSISVDLRVPGALQTVNTECNRLLDTLGLRNSFSIRTGGHSFGIQTINKGLFGNVRTKEIVEPITEDISRINLIGSNTVFQFPSHPTLSLSRSSIQNTVIVDSQEELLGISKLCVNAIEYNPVAQSAVVETSKSAEVNPVVDQSSVEERLDRGTSKGTEAMKTSLAFETLGLEAFSSDKQLDSVIENINLSKNSDKSFDSLWPVPKSFDFSMIHEKKRKRRLNNDRADKLPDDNGKSPIAAVEKRATPLGKKRLPLKKRSVAHIFSSTHNLPQVNKRFLCDRSLVTNDTDEGKRTGSIESIDKGASSAPPHVFGVERPEDIPSASADGLYEADPDSAKIRKLHVDLAWKLSLPHISESFFNDPDVSAKFRKGEISLSASHGTSSKSTRPRKHFSEGLRPQSILNSSVEHEFQDVDLNSPKPGAEDVSREDAVSPSSVTATNDYTESPSPRTVSEKNSNSPFVEDFLEHTMDFLESENTRISQVYSRETQDDKFGSDSVSSLLKNYDSKSFVETLRDSNGDKRSSESAVSSRVSLDSSPPLSRWWNYENRTPMRKNLQENNSSVSDGSLRVLPSMSQRPVLQRSVITAKQVVHRDLPTPCTNIGLVESNEGSFRSNENRPGFDNLAAAALWDGADECKTGRSKPKDPEKAVRGKRMSLVLSDVIVKPVGAEQQSNDHDFLICEDEDFSLHLEESSS